MSHRIIKTTAGDQHDRLTNVVEHSAELIRYYLEHLCDSPFVVAAMANGASFRLIVDLDAPTRITGQLLNGPYPEELFSATFEIVTDEGAVSSAPSALQ